MTPQDTLRTLIDTSPLMQAEKNELYESLYGAGEEVLEKLCSLFLQRPELVPHFYMNLAAKKFAISANDSQAFDSVVENEIHILEKINEED
jgi:hypothetical protein